MFEKLNPKTLASLLFVAAIAYLILPYDFFPDFLGLPGRIDDVVVLGWLFWFYRNHLAQTPKVEGPEAGGAQRPDATRSQPSLDAYEVLGIPRSATPEAIRAAYRSRMQEYHPDKVAHLGEELQKLATEKSQQIQRAYQQLRR